MFLYLVQHAEALSKEEDHSRSLSDKGVEDIKKVAAFISKQNINVKRILHSGKKRSLQTAQILSGYIESDKLYSETEGLAPNDNPGIWFELISKMKDNIMLVGHLPHLAKLLSLLLFGDEKKIVNFETGSVTCLKGSEDGSWAIEWIIKPGMIK